MALGTIVLLGCSAADQSAEHPREKRPGVSKPSTSATPTPLRSHEPVTRFADQEVVLPRGAVTLDGGTAWVAAQEGLVSVDIATGESTYIRPKGQSPSTRPKLGPPVIAEVRGTRLAMSVMPVELPRTGTQRTRYAIELLAADVTTGRRAWSTQLPLDGSMGFTERSDLKVAAVNDGTAVVVDGSDLMARKVRWSKFVGVESVIAAYGGVVAVVEQNMYLEERVHGLRVTDGKQVWTREAETGLTVLPAGPSSLLITGGSDLNAYDTTLVAIRDGRSLASPDVAAVPDVCSPDGRDTIICGRFKVGQHGVFALDADSGKKLWELPTSDRNAPRFHSAWHGVVYTSLDDEGLMLDARTGEDRPAPLPQAPDLVNGFVGVFVRDDTTGLNSEPLATAHRTSG